MPLTDYPNGITSFGAPVSGGSNYNFAGWWGNDIWFVDFDNGTRTGQRGKNDMENPQKDLYQSLQDCGAGDTIFIRPRTTVVYAGSNSVGITPAATEAANWTIAKAKPHVSIIGTSRNQGIGRSTLLQSYAALTTPTINVLSQYCTIENLGFKMISSQVGFGAVRAYWAVPGTSEGFALTVDNCSFENEASGNGGAVHFDSGRYNRCLNTEFWHCKSGVYIVAGAKSNHGNVIQNCIFHGAGSGISNDILIGTADHLLIDRCIFSHDAPTAGRANYIAVLSSAEGTVSNC